MGDTEKLKSLRPGTTIPTKLLIHTVLKKTFGNFQQKFPAGPFGVVLALIDDACIEHGSVENVKENAVPPLVRALIGFQYWKKSEK